MSLPLFHVDAFTDRPFGGNPAAVCLLSGEMDARWMAQVAAEMNLSETAFVQPQQDGFGLRWFTPTVEVDLCGHATLATAHVLWQEGRAAPGEVLRFHTRSGVLTAARRGEDIELDFPLEPAEETAAPPDLAAGLGVPLLHVGRNRFDILAEVDSEATLRTLAPDIALLARVPVRGVIVTSRSADPRFDFVSRFFAPNVGVPEDPVCGSAHCCLGPYWSKRLGKDALVGYQASARGGVVRVRVSGQRAFLGGRAVIVTRGNLVAEGQSTSPGQPEPVTVTTPVPSGGRPRVLPLLRWRTLFRAAVLALPLLTWLALFLSLGAYLPPLPRAVLPWSQEMPFDKARIQFSADGGTLLTAFPVQGCGSLGGPLGLWDLRTGQRKSVLRCDDDACFDRIVISPDGKWVAAVQVAGTVWLWDAASGEPVAVPPLQTEPSSLEHVFCFSPDSRTLAVTTPGGFIARYSLHLLDVASGQERASVSESKGDVFWQAGFSPDSRWLVTESQSGGLRVWDSVTGQQQALLAEPPIYKKKGFWFSPDGSLLACRDNESLQLWDVPAFTLRVTLPQAIVDEADLRRDLPWRPAPRRGPSRLVLFSGDGRTLATQSREGIKTWDLPAGSLRNSIRDEPDEFLELDGLSRDGRLVVTVTHWGEDGLHPFLVPRTVRLFYYRLWDVSARPAHEVGEPLDDRPRLLPAEGLVVVHDRKAHTVNVLDARQDRTRSSVPGYLRWTDEDFPGQQGPNLLSADGQYLAVESGPVPATGLVARWLLWLRLESPGGNEVFLWNLRTGRQVAWLRHCGCHGFSPDGRTLVTGHYNGSLALWDVPPRRSALLLYGLPSLFAVLMACLCWRILRWRRAST